MTRSAICPMLAVLALTLSCNSRENKPRSLRGDEDLVLYVANISPAMPDVEIEVFLDGSKVATSIVTSRSPRTSDGYGISDRARIVKRGSVTSSVARECWGFYLQEGKHDLKFVVPEVGVENSISFVLTRGRKWVLATFDFSPGGSLGIKIPATISIVAQDHQFAFG